MKRRVVCFDLFGTLASSGYVGKKYHECLGSDSQYSGAVIRGQAMRATASPAEIRYLDFLFCQLRPLFKGIGGVNEWQQIANFWQQENEELNWLEGAMEVLSTVSKDSIVVLATNITLPGKNALLEKLSNVESVFDRLYWSCHLPVAKPDPYVWQLIQQENPAKEYWMIGDDPLIDLAMPAAMGWKTILVGEKGIDIAEVPKILEAG